MISKFLSGYFLGAEETLALSYSFDSSQRYAEIQRERSGKNVKDTAVRVRNYLFAIHTIAFSLGFFIGPGE